MDKVDLRAFIFCSTVFLCLRPGEPSSYLIFPTGPNSALTFPASFSFFSSSQSPSYSAVGQQSRQNGKKEEKWVSSTQLGLLAESQWRKKELHRGRVLKGMLVWGLCLYMHTEAGKQTKRLPSDARGNSEDKD